jgi:hypothetical protein
MASLPPQAKMMTIFHTGWYELDIKLSVSVSGSCENDCTFRFSTGILSRLLTCCRHWKALQREFAVELLTATQRMEPH